MQAYDASNTDCVNRQEPYDTTVEAGISMFDTNNMMHIPTDSLFAISNIQFGCKI